MKPPLQVFLLIVLFFITTKTLKFSPLKQHKFTDFGSHQRYCLQELNKFVTNDNGNLVQGEGFLAECQNSHVFKAQRSGIILEAECPDDDGLMHTASKFLQILPPSCKYDH
jgi:hypothetical protein